MSRLQDPRREGTVVNAGTASAARHFNHCHHHLWQIDQPINIVTPSEPDVLFNLITRPPDDTKNLIPIHKNT